MVYDHGIRESNGLNDGIPKSMGLKQFEIWYPKINQLIYCVENPFHNENSMSAAFILKQADTFKARL